MKTKNFKFKSMALVLFALVLSSNVWGEDTWTQVTSVAVGDEVVIAVVDDGTKELTSISTTATKYGIGTDFTTNPAGTMTWKVEEGSSTGTFAFKNGTNYLRWNSGNSVDAAGTAVEGKTSWTITTSNSRAKVANVHTSSRILMWNKSNPRFACYEGKNHGNNNGTYYYYVIFYKKEASCANKVTVTKGTPSPSNGTFELSQTGEVCIDEGNATVNVTDIAPEEHYHFSQITATNGTVDNVNKKVTDISANTIINVEFAEDSKVTVTFSDAIHDNNSGYMEYVGDKIQFPTITDAAKGDGCVGEHYHFVGWTKDASQPNALVTPASETAPATDITYYAVWAKEDE
ncbi:MAG: hypothetical protein KBS70_04405 [Bacteroidales bacterium]|nr:hypothetical protein [Candidatus Colicola equi]